MRRREFGRQALRLAAGLGLTSISISRTGGLMLLGGCADDPSMPLDGRDGRIDGDALPAIAQASSKTSVLVIGSGYGSAVTALRLTEAGIPVTMLEAGRLWQPGADGLKFCKPFQPDGRAMWFEDKTETQMDTFLGAATEMPVPREAGVLEARGPKTMRVFQGKGVGGGSLVNMALYLAPEKAKVRQILPTIDADAFVDKYIARAAQKLKPGQASQRAWQSEFYRYGRVGQANAEKAGFKTFRLQSGYDFEYMDRELDNKVPLSALGGEAGFGNNYGKRSLDQTYLAEALGTGLLTIHALHIVKNIKTDPSGGYVVDVEQIDVKGAVLGKKQLTCTHLFVGAGSMASSELLVRARERGDLPNLNKAVGTKWGPNGDLFIALDNPLTSPTGLGQQATIPPLAFATNDAKGRRVVSQIAPLPMGLPLWTSLVIMIADNPEAGHFTYDASRDAVNLNWAREQNQPSVDAAKFIFDQINAKAKTSYSTTIAFKDKGQFGDQVTYHPVGGIPLGEATDDYGRIKEHPGLYVVDSALIPLGIGANPSLSITALAERNIETVLATDFASVAKRAP
ncbi:MAG: GMC oxidoreductase [Polyangiales bacterium]